ncbi:MAG: hypothetical protein HETSPECPRED_001428 [Heterodermia speciosa]|uniref:Uncharacterized protein n=1 Tax=Heterodermia speciosa TaxID=116794 RepID=A0A8H3J1G4_9LECA|nr:MAG: hypothetical protein HETSPECPRED_001428 [Heterodermia speciosa]
MIQESTAIQQVSHTEQNPWLIAESQPHPIARHVRYVEPGTRLPIDPNNPARHTDLTRTEQPLPAHELSYQQPYRETETIRHWESTYQRRPIEVPRQETRTSFSEQMVKDFPDLESSLIASVVMDAPTIASAIGALSRIREEDRNLQAARYKQLAGPRDESSRTQQGNDSVRLQSERSRAAVQDLLESEYPRLDTRVVAVTFRDSGYDLTFTRRVLTCLSDF